MLSEHLVTIASLLRRMANRYGGRLYLSRKTTDILLSNLQAFSDDIRRYETSDRGMEVQSPAILAILRELTTADAHDSDVFERDDDAVGEPKPVGTSGSGFETPTSHVLGINAPEDTD